MPIAFLVFYLVIRSLSINYMVCVSFPLKNGAGGRVEAEKIIHIASRLPNMLC